MVFRKFLAGVLCSCLVLSSVPPAAANQLGKSSSSQAKPVVLSAAGQLPPVLPSSQRSAAVFSLISPSGSKPPSLTPETRKKALELLLKPQPSESEQAELNQLLEETGILTPDPSVREAVRLSLEPSPSKELLDRFFDGIALKSQAVPAAADGARAGLRTAARKSGHALRVEREPIRQAEFPKIESPSRDANSDSGSFGTGWELPASVLAFVGASALWFLADPGSYSSVVQAASDPLAPLLASAFFWGSRKDEKLEAVESLDQLGFKAPSLSKVSEAAGEFYENIRKNPPKARLEGRKEIFSQRDLTRSWALSFKQNYLMLRKAVPDELAAMLSFYEALEFSYGASLDFDPADPARGDRKDYLPAAAASLSSLAGKLGLSTFKTVSASGQPMEPLESLEELAREKAGLSLKEIFEKAEQTAGSSSPPALSDVVEKSGAVLRDFESMKDQFLDEVLVDGQKVPIQSAQRLLKHIRTAVHLKLPVLLKGPTGTGKTAAPKWLAARSGTPHLSVAMKPAIGNEEMIGSVRPTSKGLAWQWGFLIKAVFNGDWVTLEEFNLAPTEVLEALNEFFNSGFIRLTQYLDEETLKTVLPQKTFKALKSEGFILKPHPRFRIFLTMNPESYSARNKLAQTLMNRTVQIWAPDYSPNEMESILQARFKVTKERAVQLVELIYLGLKKEIDGKKLGREQKDKYVLNLRTLLRAVKLYKENLELYKKAAGKTELDEKTDMILLGRALWETFGFTMRTETDRKGLWTLLDAALGFNNHGISLADILPRVKAVRYDSQNKEVVFEDELLPLRIPIKGGGAFVPPESFDLPPTPSVLNTLYWLSRRLQKGEHVLLVGETASGKTSQVQYLHRLLNAVLYYTNLSSESANEELEGGYQPDPQNPGKFHFVHGKMQKAGTEYEGRGTTLFIDEFNLNTLVEWFNTAQDDRTLITPEGAVPLGPDTVIMGAMNRPQTQGRNMLSPALRGRLWEMWVEEPDKQEATLRIGWLLKKLIEGGLKTVLALAAGGTAYLLGSYLGSFSSDSAVLAAGFLLAASLQGFFGKPKKSVIKESNGSPGALAFSPDGDRLAVGTDQGTVRIWDARSLKEIHSLKGIKGEVSRLAFSRDGRKLAVLDDGINFRGTIWDAYTGERISTLEEMRGSISGFSFSADSARLFTSSGFGGHVWDVFTGKQLKLSRSLPVAILSSDWQKAVRFNFGSGILSHVVIPYIWDIMAEKKLADLDGAADGAGPFRWSPDGKKVAALSHDQYIKVWDAETGKSLHLIANTKDHFKGRAVGISSFSFGPDWKKIVLASVGKAYLWDISEDGRERLIGEFKKDSSENDPDYGGFKLTAFSPEGSRLALAGEKEIELVNLNADKERMKEMERELSQEVEKPKEDSKKEGDSPGRDPYGIRWDAGLKALALAFGTAALLPGVSYAAGEAAMAGSALLPFLGLGAALGLASGSGREGFFAPKDRKTFRGHSRQVLAAGFRPDGKRAVSVDRGGVLKIWDADKGTILDEKQLPFQVEDGPKSWLPQNILDWASDGKIYLTLGGEIWVLDPAQGSARKLESPKNQIEAVSSSPDGAKLAALSQEDGISILDVQTGKKIVGFNKISNAIGLKALALFSKLHENKDLWFWGAVGLFAFVSLGLKADSVFFRSVSFPLHLSVFLLTFGNIFLAAISGSLFSRRNRTKLLFSLDLPVGRPAWSRDGTKVIFARKKGKLVLLDSKTGKRASTLGLESNKPLALGLDSTQLSRDGSRLAARTDAGEITAWDARTGESVRRFKGRETALAFALSSDGERIAFAHSKRIEILGVSGGETFFVLEDPSYDFKGGSIAFDPDGKRLMTADETGMTLWDLEYSPQQLKKMEEELSQKKENPQEAPSKGDEASGRDPYGIRWDAGLKALALAFGISILLPGVSYAADGMTQAAGMLPSLVLGASLGFGSSFFPKSDPLNLNTKGSTVADIQFSSDGSLVAVAGSDGVVSLRDAKTDKPLRFFQRWWWQRLWDFIAGASMDIKLLRNLWKDRSLINIWDFMNDRIRKISFSLDGARLAATYPTLTVVWDVKTGKRLGTFHHNHYIYHSRFDRRGSQLAAAAWRGIVVWDVSTGKKLELRSRKDWEAWLETPEASFFSPEDKADLAMRFYDVSALMGGEEDQYVMGRPRYDRFSPDGKTIATNSVLSVSCFILTLEKGKAKILHTLPDQYRPHVFSPNGSLLVTEVGHLFNARTLTIWDVASGKKLHELKGHGAWIHDIAFSRDGSRLASIDNANITIVWDVAAGKPLHILYKEELLFPLAAHSYHGIVRFSADGAYLARAYGKGAVIEKIGMTPEDLARMGKELSQKVEKPREDPKKDGDSSGRDPYGIRWDSSLGFPE